MNENKSRCPNKALYAVPWGGKILMSCEIHARSMAALGNAIGSPVEMRAINPGSANCDHPNDLEEYEKAKKG